MKVSAIVPDDYRNPMGGMGIFVAAIKDRLNWNLIENTSLEVSPVKTTEFKNVIHQVLNNYNIVPILQEQNPDLVHSCDWSAGWPSHIYTHASKKKHIYHVHLGIRDSMMGQLKDPETKGFLEMIIRAVEDCETTVMEHADHIIHVSHTYKNKYPKFFNHKSSVIHNGIDFDYWQSDYNSIPLPGDRRIKVVYIGRFAAMKNVEAILDAEIPEDIDIIFAGGPRCGEPDILKRAIRESKEKEYFHCVGPVSGDIKKSLLRGADAIMVPSLVEPFGIVGLEGLASQSLVLSSRSQGLGEFLDDDCSIHCGTTSESISLSLKQLSEMTNKEKQVLIQNGLERAKDFDWSKTIEKIQEVYTSVMEN